MRKGACVFVACLVVLIYVYPFSTTQLGSTYGMPSGDSMSAALFAAWIWDMAASSSSSSITATTSTSMRVVAVRCSVLQRVAMCCGVLWCVVVCSSVLQYDAV